MSNVYIEPYHSARREIERLEVINAELLAALKHVIRDLEAIADNTNDGRVPLLARMSAHNARAAITKAEGTS